LAVASQDNDLLSPKSASGLGGSMHRTIFDTPVINSALRAVSIAILRLHGWTVEGRLPPEARKSVFIAAPHTSNWDLPYTLMVAFALCLNIY